MPHWISFLSPATEKNLINPWEWDTQKESPRSHVKHWSLWNYLSNRQGLESRNFLLEEYPTQSLRFTLSLRFYKNVFRFPLENSSLLPFPSWQKDFNTILSLFLPLSNDYLNSYLVAVCWGRGEQGRWELGHRCLEQKAHEVSTKTRK